MGEVYRAHDTSLGRDVAIKVLSAALDADLAGQGRLEREARALAALNHANTATLFGVERVGQSRTLVMELVEGDTLAERVSRGPLPAGDALAIARQVAEAMKAAHGKGIVHRDLKPANIKITAGASSRCWTSGWRRRSSRESDMIWRILRRLRIPL